ncbi:DUF485 domain-containing protein [Rhodococcoides yunnanense]|uniref:DUF485 domain-containing protein n=1 Tax=Rhodococcoides yunnanense TaxID=278209 RepID=UPI0009330E18|nr:DUF485 domain-containing protein [Rhodococcus yunnanensis]
MTTRAWLPILDLPEFVELRRRRRRVTTVLGTVAVALFASFLIAFAYFPAVLGDTEIVGIPLSLWVVFSQFVGTWVLVYAYLRLSRTYIAPAVSAAVHAIDQHAPDQHAEESVS